MLQQPSAGIRFEFWTYIRRMRTAQAFAPVMAMRRIKMMLFRCTIAVRGIVRDSEEDLERGTNVLMRHQTYNSHQHDFYSLNIYISAVVDKINTSVCLPRIYLEAPKTPGRHQNWN